MSTTTYTDPNWAPQALINRGTAAAIFGVLGLAIGWISGSALLYRLFLRWIDHTA